MNRVKYNSWYKRLEQRNVLSSSQQPTLEVLVEDPVTEEAMDDLGEVQLDDLKDDIDD